MNTTPQTNQNIDLINLPNGYGSSKRVLDTPPINKKSTVKRSMTNVQLPRPIAQTQPIAHVFNKDGVSAILLLLFTRGPSAVFSRIMTIRIYTVDLSVLFSKFCNMLFIALMHVADKFIKRAPRTSYASAAVTPEFIVGRMRTATLKFIKDISKPIFRKPVFISVSFLLHIISRLTAARFTSRLLSEAVKLLMPPLYHIL